MTGDAPILCWRTTRAIAFSEAWPINNAQNERQMLCSRRSFPTPRIFDDLGAASMSRLVLHTSVHFLRFEDFFVVAKGDVYALADRDPGFSPSRARASARKDSIRASVMGVTVRPCPE